MIAPKLVELESDLLQSTISEICEKKLLILHQHMKYPINKLLVCQNEVFLASTFDGEGHSFPVRCLLLF